MTGLLIEDIVTQKIIHWILPEPSEILEQFQNNQGLADTFYLMYALMYPQKRRDTSPAARHPYDSAVRDLARDVGYHLSILERKVLLGHDLAEDLCQNISSAFVINDIIGDLLEDHHLYDYLNLMTDHYSILWKPLQKKLEKNEYRQMRHFTLEEIINIFQCETMESVDRNQVIQYYSNIKDRLIYFNIGIQDIYEAYGRQKNAKIKVKNLKNDDFNFIIDFYNKMICKIDQKIETLNILSIAELEDKVNDYKEIVYKILSSIHEGDWEDQLEYRRPDRVDKRLILSGENPVFLNISKTLYYEYVERFLSHLNQERTTRQYSTTEGDALINPLVVKISDAIDNVRTLPRDILPSMRNIYQKARCLIRKGKYLCDQFGPEGSDVDRLNTIINLLFVNLEEKNRIYKEGVGDIENLDTSYRESLRITVSMIEKNDLLKVELDLG